MPKCSDAKRPLHQAPTRGSAPALGLPVPTVAALKRRHPEAQFCFGVCNCGHDESLGVPYRAEQEWTIEPLARRETYP